MPLRGGRGHWPPAARPGPWPPLAAGYHGINRRERDFSHAKNNPGVIDLIIPGVTILKAAPKTTNL